MQRDHAALVAFVNERHTMPHALGRRANDCVAFALEAAHRQTGHRRATKLRWETPAQVARIIAKFGSLEGAFDHFFQRIPPAFAMRGDIAAVPDDQFGIHPMVVEGDLLVGPGDAGNRRMPRAAMVCAWSVTAPQPRSRKAKA